jgi:hypothetical protein
MGREMALTTGAGTEDFAFAWDAGHYLLVYSDTTTGSGDLKSLRFSTDGMPLAMPTGLESSPGAATVPNLAKLQSGWAVTWQEGMAGAMKVKALRLDDSGAAKGGPVDVATSMAEEARPTIARAPGGVAIAWTDGKQEMTSVLAASYSDALAPQGAPVTVGSEIRAWPWLVSDGTNLAILTSVDVSGTPNYQMRISTLDASLASMQDATVRDEMGEARLGRMIKTSYGYLASWEDSRTGDNEIYMALADANGKVIYSGLVEEPESGDANWSNMATDGTQSAIVYYQFRDGAPQIFVSFVDNKGQRVGGGHDLQVSTTTDEARYPQVAWNGSDYGIAWVDTRDGAPQVYFAQVKCR